MEEVKVAFLKALLQKSPELVASVWIIDKIPLPFADDLELFATWRAQLARGLGVDPSSLVITGSSAFGISLNPYKNYRFFDETSDIDVAVISDYHFGVAWRTLRELGSARHRLAPPIKQSLADHVSKYIYWGTIATDRLLPVLPFGKVWQEALEAQQKVAPTIGRVINARIYRDHDSLRGYQVTNLKNLRTKELERGL